MQPWSLRAYKRPYLAVDLIALEDDGLTIVLAVDGGAYRIACGDAEVARTVAAKLAELREPDAAVWRSLRAGDETDLAEIVGHLDRGSLLRDAAPPSRAAETDAALREAAATVRARFSDAARPGVAGIVDRLLAEADALTGGRRSVEAPPPAAEPDFYLGVLRLQLRYLARAAPPALAAVRGMLRLLSDGPRSDVHSATAAVGLYEERTIRASLTAFADGIPRCAAPGSARLCSLPPPATGAVTGLDLALAAERLIRREAGRLGPQRLIAALRERPTLPLIAGCYVEQWHLTCRFPEFVAPMLSKRLDPELRRRMFDYLGEEIGHDRLERDSCLSIGLMAGELDAALPLPLCMAFADAMTHLAETDSLGYLLSIMVAEGLMGDDFRIGALLGQQLRRLGYRDPEGARRHDETNAELNHTGIVRQVMRGIPAIAPAAQDRALSNLMLMLELNRRGWDAVLDFYGKEGPVVHHGWLSARVASTGACNASSSP